MNHFLPSTVYPARLAQFQEALEKHKLNALLLHTAPYVFHLTGWLPPAWARACLVVSPLHVTLVSSIEPDDAFPIWDQVILHSIGNLAPFLDALDAAVGRLELDRPRLGVQAESLPGTWAVHFEQRASLEETTALLFGLTSVHDSAALEQVRRRIALLDEAFETARRVLHAGLTEIELYAEMYSTLTVGLGAPFTLECDIGSGERSLEAEPQPSKKVIEQGEVVVIDLFPNLGGYVADYCRNFVAGRASQEQIEQHRVLEKALRKAEEMLRPGLLAADLDRAVRSVIEEEGFGKLMYRHHTGHAFGLTSPEPPVILPGSDGVLRAGMVIAIEPGIYHLENGGMRLEGNFYITDEGCERLEKFPAELVQCF